MATWKKLLHESSPAGDFPTLNQSTTGNAGTATTLATGRSLKVSLGSTSASTTFDGSANITDIGVSGTLGVGSGGTGLSSYTSGDILYASGSTTLTKLAKGSDGQVLSLASGVPAWADASSGDITGVTAGTGLDGGGSSGAVSLAVGANQTTVRTMYFGELAIGSAAAGPRIEFNDTNNTIVFSADDSADTLVLENTDASNDTDTLRPVTDRGVNLGTSSYRFGDAFFRTGYLYDGVINNLKIGTSQSSVAVTSTAAELNILDGVTADKDEINILDGLTATTQQLNYVDATSSIQTQLNGKQASGSYQSTLTFGIANGNAVDIDDTDVATGDYAKFTANGLQGRSASEVLSDIGAQAAGSYQSTLTFGISNTNAVKIDSSSVADNEYARFTANGLESRSASEVRSDIGAAAAAGSTGQHFSANNMTVAGNLVVSGTSTIQNSTVETVNISDVQLKLGAGLSGTSRDLALVFDRGGANAVAEGVVTTNGLDAALYYDATTGFLSMAGVPTNLNEGDNTPDDISAVTGVENIKQVLLGSSSTSTASGDQVPIGSIHVDTNDDGGTPYMRIA